jgi:hypothetical protein
VLVGLGGTIILFGGFIALLTLLNAPPDNFSHNEYLMRQRHAAVRRNMLKVALVGAAITMSGFAVLLAASA